MSVNNVGDSKTFMLDGSTPAQPMRYVWAWWDGSVDVTTAGTVTRRLNIGGNPADSYQVHFTCEAVNEVGQASLFMDSVVVNNPPSLVFGSTSLLNNGNDFPFATRASLIAYDLEGDVPGFDWFVGGQPLTGVDNSIYGLVNGTYAGTIAKQCVGVRSAIDCEVVSDGSLTCRVWDNSGGTTVVQFYLFGQSPTQQYSAAQAASSQTAVDSVSDSVVRIGAASSAEFTVYTQADSNPTNFNWTFHGSNGWAATTYSAGVTTELANGAYRSQATKATQTELPGQKYAECFIVDSVTGNTTDVVIPVYLELNADPVIASTLVLPVDPAVGDVLSFEVTATDDDLDILTYTWYFAEAAITMYGRKVFVDTTGVTAGSSVHAVLTVTDLMGAQITQNVESEPLAP